MNLDVGFCPSVSNSWPLKTIYIAPSLDKVQQTHRHRRQKQPAHGKAMAPLSPTSAIMSKSNALLLCLFVIFASFSQLSNANVDGTDQASGAVDGEILGRRMLHKRYNGTFPGFNGTFPSFNGTKVNRTRSNGTRGNSTEGHRSGGGREAQGGAAARGFGGGRLGYGGSGFRLAHRYAAAMSQFAKGKGSVPESGTEPFPDPSPKPGFNFTHGPHHGWNGTQNHTFPNGTWPGDHHGWHNHTGNWTHGNWTGPDGPHVPGGPGGLGAPGNPRGFGGLGRADGRGRGNHGSNFTFGLWNYTDSHNHTGNWTHYHNHTGNWTGPGGRHGPGGPGGPGGAGEPGGRKFELDGHMLRADGMGRGNHGSNFTFGPWNHTHSHNHTGNWSHFHNHTGNWTHFHNHTSNWTGPGGHHGPGGPGGPGVPGGPGGPRGGRGFGRLVRAVFGFGGSHGSHGPHFNGTHGNPSAGNCTKNNGTAGNHTRGGGHGGRSMEVRLY